MLKKVLLAIAVVVVVLAAAGFFWAKSVLTGEAVRSALAAQVSNAIGQPVAIEALDATAYPRVTVNLSGVRIGEPARVQIATLRLGTDFRALLSRRIEHASVRLSGARVELPLPPFRLGGESRSPDSGTTSKPPVELVSIDEVLLSDVQIVSGGRTLRGDIEVVPEGQGFLLRKVSLRADDLTLNATGRITDPSGPVGELTVKSTALHFDRLMAFASDFSGGAGLNSSTEAAHAKPATQGTGAPSRMDVAVSLEAERGTMGQLTIDKLAGKAHITAQTVSLEPIAFGIFGGRYEGSLNLTPDREAVAIRARAKLTGIDVAAATRFAGSPDTITGRLSGRLDVSARGADPTTLTKTAHGSARVDIVDGIIKNLGLVQSVVVATSMRADASKNLGSGSKDEPFSKLGATLTIANGAVTTNDLRLESKDLSLAAQGVVQLSPSTLNLKGQIQLSDALSQQAGRDLVRYTQEQGRVTLPATVVGPAESPHVSIDVGDVAKRALRNAVVDEAQKRLKNDAISKGLSGLFKR